MLLFQRKDLKFSFVIMFFALFFSFFMSTSCKKNSFLSHGNLTFSKDTVVFDTVFTTIGSTTQQFKIYNKDTKTIQISQIELMGGSSSPFRINIDGLSGTHFSDIEIEGKDSLFAFVEVTLNPNGGSLPMVIEDSIRFRTNGKDQYIILAAWGQDIYYHYSDMSGNSTILDSNEGTWPNDKPHLIYGAAFVYEGKQLTIPAGTKIHLHKNSFLFVYKGTLNIEGQLGNEVIIQGDRLESDYKDVAGQYYGIYFKEAKTSSINYAIIKNGTTGIHIEKDGANGANPTVIVKNTIIQNNTFYGIMNFAGGKIVAENVVLAKNGYHGFINLVGSSFDFNHCTFAGYASGKAQLPVVGISDFYKEQNGNVLVTDITGSIKNSVIYGYQDNEIAINLDDIGTNNITIDHCLIKLKNPSTEPYYSSIIWNTNPDFKDVQKYDFEVWSSSPMIHAGVPTSLMQDIKGKVRSATPTLGAYEY